MGEIVFLVTVDADGKVQHVTAILDKPNQQVYPLLQNAALENMQLWTFAKPPFAPYTEVVMCDYEDDPSLPPSGGPKALPIITRVVFDLPDHVRTLTNVPMTETDKSKSSR